MKLICNIRTICCAYVDFCGIIYVYYNMQVLIIICILEIFESTGRLYGT